MLTIETERRITKLFLALVNGELSCLPNRLRLITHKEFNAFQCFKHLDQKGKEYINAYDIVHFFKLNNTFCTIDEAEMIILFYDKDNSNYMSYSNFFIMLYSGIGFDPSLLFKESSSLMNSNPLSSSVEYMLYELLSNELAVVREAKKLLKTINDRYDFNAIELFKAMEGRECITEHNLFVLLKRNGRQLSKEEMGALFNRLNIEKSGGISLRELTRLFAFSIEQEMKGNKTWTYYDNNYLASSLSIFNHSQNISTNSITLDNDVNRSKRYFTPDFPLKPFSLNESYRNELLISKRKFEHQLLNPPEYNQIYDLFRLMIETERMIEQLKCELALRADFNIEDAFCLFTSKESSHITEKELYYGLCSLEIEASSDDVKILIDKYDLRYEGVIAYSDLFNLLVPFNKDYRTMVEMRLPANYCPKHNKTDVFLNVTKYYLRNLLRAILIQERNVFNMKSKHQPIYRLYIEKIFNQMDNESKGYITPKDLGGYLKDHNVILTQNESDLLFIRLDRQREGKITMSNFIQQFLNLK